MKSIKLNKSFLKALIYLILSVGFFYAGFALGQPGAGGAGEASASGLGGIASNVTNTFTDFAKLITAGAFLGGLGFAFLAILQFKAHRDSPSQNPLGKPIMYLFIAVALLFLPYLVNQAGKTVFGPGGRAGTISGEAALDNT